MKIVVAYDGSEFADAAINAMPRAGLPERAEAVVLSIDDGTLLSVGELSEPLEEEAAEAMGGARRQEAWAMARALEVAAWGRDRLGALFPGWEIGAEGVAGSPTWGILAKTDSWEPDLAILGSHGRSLLGRLFIGSVSQSIATEARCSVHIARGRMGSGETPPRLVIGLDGSPDSLAAVAAVASRRWPAGTAVRLVVADAAHRAGGSVAVAPEEWGAGERALRMLRDAGLDAMMAAPHGRPAHALMEQADAWGAECIFVGARGAGLLDRVRLGSVAASVAARAGCSVEIVRSHNSTSAGRAGE